MSACRACDCLPACLPRLARPPVRAADQNYYNAVSTVVSLFWGFKIFYGFLSDSVALCGYRRRSWIVVGWVLSTAFTAAQAVFVTAQENTLICFGGEESGYAQTASFPKDAANAQCPEGTFYQTVSINAETFDSKTYVALMLAINFSYMLADVTADSLAVEYATRESERERGRIQAYNYVCRFTAGILVSILVGFALNTPLYGGTFTTGMSISSIMWVTVACQLVGLPFYFFLQESKARRELLPSCCGRLRECWLLLENKGFATLMIFQVLFNLLVSISYTGQGALADVWCGVSALQYSLSNIFGYVRRGRARGLVQRQVPDQLRLALSASLRDRAHDARGPAHAAHHLGTSAATRGSGSSPRLTTTCCP